MTICLNSIRQIHIALSLSEEKIIKNTKNRSEAQTGWGLTEISQIWPQLLGIREMNDCRKYQKKLSVGGIGSQSIFNRLQ